MIHAIDLHYHAGLERQAGLSLGDYLEHAVMTGRRVLGITDHLDLYLRPQQVLTNPAYSQDLQGLLALRADLDNVRAAFPSLRLLFAPEVPPSFALADIPQPLVDAADYFICEADLAAASCSANTLSLQERFQEIAAFRAATGKPIFAAHPLRHAINLHLVKAPIPPWLRELSLREPLVFTQAERTRFSLLDPAAVGQTAAECGIPLEINGNTWERARAANLPAPLSIMLAIYRIWQACGVQFVVGSDQHAIRRSVGRFGGAVPWEVCDALGIEASDIGFLEGI